MDSMPRFCHDAQEVMGGPLSKPILLKQVSGGALVKANSPEAGQWELSLMMLSMGILLL